MPGHTPIPIPTGDPDGANPQMLPAEKAGLAAPRILVTLLRDSTAPAALLWGQDLICLHNAAFCPLLPQGAPAQGRGLAVLWPEGGGVAALVEAVLAGRAQQPETFAFPQPDGTAFFRLVCSATIWMGARVNQDDALTARRWDDGWW